MKPFYTFLLMLGLLMALAVPASGAANNGLTILVDGFPIDASLAYITDGGTTMVPLRAVSEALGCDVGWEQATRTITITSASEKDLPEAAAPEKSAVVVLDPGHGGSANGAEYGGIKEKDLNLAIALQAAQILESEGVTVKMTRRTDQDVDLYARTDFANALQADIFVSVHCNASEEYEDALGVYTCAHHADSPGWTLAEMLHDAMIASTGAEDAEMEERPNLAVLRTSEMPAALVECGFMSTPAELDMLVQTEYQAMLARGIADGVLAYLGSR